MILINSVIMLSHLQVPISAPVPQLTLIPYRKTTATLIISRSKHNTFKCTYKQKQTPRPLVRKRTIPTERPPLVDEI
jgi:hypothetical protein